MSRRLRYAAISVLCFCAAPLLGDAPPAEAQEKALDAAPFLTQTSDVFLGQTKSGPYLLAWKPVDPGALAVVVDGKTLTPNAYTLHAAAGTISFKTPLTPRSVVRVDYRYDAAVAERNALPASQPFTIPLLQTRIGQSRADLQVTALPLNPSAGAQGPLLVWGLQGKTRLLQGDLSSQLLLGPDAPGQSGSLGERTGVKFDYGFATSANKMNASFGRAGKAFAPGSGGRFGLGEPAQRWSLDVESSPSRRFTWTAALGGTRDLANQGASDRNAWAMHLMGTGNAPTLHVSRSQSTRSGTKNAAESVTTEKADLSGKLGGARYAAQGERVTTNNATRTEAGHQVEMMLQPSTSLTLRAQERQQTTTSARGGPSTQTRFRSAQGTVKPFKDALLTGAFKTNQNGTERIADGKVQIETRIGNQGALVARGQRVTKDGSKPADDRVQQDAFISLSAAAKNNPTNASLQVSGANVETATGVVERQSVVVTLQPAPTLSLSAQARLQTTTPYSEDHEEERAIHQTAGVAFKPFKGARLSGSVATAEEEDQRTSVTDVQAELGTGRFVAVSGRITDRDADQDSSLDTTRIRMTLRPLGGLSLSGGLTLNPDIAGKVSESLRHEVGLSARVGGLEFASDYAVTTLALSDPADGRAQGSELLLKLGMRWGRSTRLTGNYKDTFFPGAFHGHGTRAYAFGFAHNLGSAFNLSLSGSRTQDKARIDAPAEVKAEAKLGLKF